MNTALIAGIVCGLLGWLLNNLYQNLNEKIRGKVGKECHDQCTKAKDEMNKLLLDEIRGLRNDFRDKSEIVVSAVTKRKRK